MNKRYIMMLFVLLLLGLGYASLSTNLNITGTTTLKDNRWDIHLENVYVYSESVSTTTPVINDNRDTVNYNVTLNKPGDFYEFYVDAVNAGSIDGMISNVSSKLNGVEITSLPSALYYSVTYEDDIEIETNHLLEVGNRITYKIRVEYRTDIEASDLPDTEQTLNFSFSVTYIQADSSAIKLPFKYSVSNMQMHVGDLFDDSNGVDNYKDVVAANDNQPLFIKYVLDDDHKIKNYSLGFVYNNVVYYIIKRVQLKAFMLNDYYERNKQSLFNVLGSDKCTIKNLGNMPFNESIDCNADSIIINTTSAFGNSSVSVPIGQDTVFQCRIYENYAYCREDDGLLM